MQATSQVYISVGESQEQSIYDEWYVFLWNEGKGQKSTGRQGGAGGGGQGDNGLLEGVSGGGGGFGTNG